MCAVLGPEAPSEAIGSTPPIRARPVEPGGDYVELGLGACGRDVKPPERSADRSPLPEEQPQHYATRGGLIWAPLDPPPGSRLLSKHGWLIKARLAPAPGRAHQAMYARWTASCSPDTRSRTRSDEGH